MIKISKKQLVAAGLILLATLLYFRINPIPFPASAEEKKNMEPYTQNMKTQCYGRFLVDVPKQSALETGGSYEFGFGKFSVEHYKKGMLNFQAYATSVERDFAAQRIRNNVSKLLHTESYSDDARMLAYYADETGIGLRTLGLVKKENVVFKVEASASDKADLDDFSRNLQGLIPHLKPLAENAIPTGPGFCINGGIITTHPRDGEYFSNGFTIPEYPELYFSFTSQVNGDNVEPGILDREPVILKSLGGMALNIKTVRKSRRDINGMQAQEWLVRLPAGDTYEYSFKLEIPGKPNSIADPTIRVGMSVGGQDESGNVMPVNMTEDEALLIWDAVTSRIRLRPGAV